MASRLLIGGLLFLGAAPAMAQINQKPIQLPPAFGLRNVELSRPVAAQRTIEVLRAAGILKLRTDSPFTLSARQPFLDPQTYLTVEGGSLYPERDTIVLNDRSAVTIHWFGNPDLRYVIDCAFGIGTGAIRFDWSGEFVRIGGDRQYDEIPLIGGRSAIVLPPGASSSVRITQQGTVELSSCDVTPFGE